MTLPVSVDGKQYLFLLDTGSSNTLYDSSLSRGEPIGTVTLGAIRSIRGGAVSLPRFKSPKAYLGKLPLPDDSPTFSLDLTKFRLISGHAIYGVLGMDFMRNQVVRVDCDRGEVAFLKIPGKECGRKFRLSSDPSGCPTVEVSVGGASPDRFLLDTGMVGWGSGDLSARHFQALADKRQLRLSGDSREETASGTEVVGCGRVETVALGDFAHRQLLFDRGTSNILGLGYLSRYVMTFDFPNNCLYLKESKRYRAPDQRDLSGLHLLRVDGKTVVHSVDKGSPAASNGIQSGDVILAVDRTKTAEYSMFSLRMLMACASDNLPLVLSRGDREFEVSLALKAQE